MLIFGDQYDTEDGTCIRDYIHVSDLAEAHLKVFEFIEQNNQSVVLNCGNGKGYSVKEVVETVKSVTGVDLKVQVDAAREGNPRYLVADNHLIQELTGWRPRYEKLDIIVNSAYEWEKSATLKSIKLKISDWLCEGCFLNFLKTIKIAKIAV